jgi:hypothetical protein
MFTVLIALAIATSAFLHPGKVESNPSQAPIVESYNCQYGQCQAIAKSTGQRCKHCVSNPGDAFCWQHM